MRRPSRTGLPLVLALCAGIPLSGQNLESLGNEDPFSFSGGISFQQVFYTASGGQLRRDPYSCVASGNINLSLYGWTVPLRFTVANNSTAFSQPFNRYALHPSWKWITAHAGYTSVSYSPYTVSGHIFLGGAIDLEPEGKWKFSALYGRFLKALEYDSTAAASHLPSYQRMGYGTKVRYGDNNGFADLIVFGAQDTHRSVTNIPDSTGVLPQQNLVVSLAGGKTVLKHFMVKAEFATSAMNRDVRAEKISHRHPLASLPGFDATRSSTFYQAVKASLDYQKAQWLLGIAYERIDPEYRTLGAYYFNNDLENITVNASSALVNGKLNAAGSAGIQRDNLDKTKVSTMRRMVGSLNISYTPGPKANYSGSYSSFQTFTHLRSPLQTIQQLTPHDYIDTLDFTQISRNASFTGMYTLSSSEVKRQQVNLQVSWQEAAEKQGDVKEASSTGYYNVNSAYTLAFIPRQMNISVGLSVTIHDRPFTHTRMIGPTAVLSRAFLQKKLRTNVSASYNETHSRDVKINTVWNARWSNVYVVREKHHLTLSAVMVKRESARENGGRAFAEFTATAGYSYSFGGKAGVRRPAHKNRTHEDL